MPLSDLTRIQFEACRALLRVAEIPVLLQTLCDLLASVPGFGWVRVTQNLKSVLVSAAEAGEGPSPPSFWEKHALDGGREVVQPDLGQGDSRFGSWASAAVIPLRVGGPWGCLAVYSALPDRFGPGETSFLRELAVDLERGLQYRLDGQRHRDNQHFLNDLANLVPGMFYRLRYSATGPRFLYVSPGVDLLLPVTPGQLTADPGLVFRSLSPADRVRFFRAARRSRDTLTVFSLEFRLVRPNGSVVWVLATAFPQRRDDAVVWTGLAIDVTPQNKLQEALQREQELLSVVLNNIGDGVVAIDREENLALMNRTAVRLLEGTDLPPGLPWNATDRFHPWFRTRADGTVLHLEAHVSDLADEGAPRRGRVMLLRDVTDRDRIEERLRQSEKLESIGLLAGGIAHDFNNLLTGVFGFIQLARMNAEDPGKVLNYLDHALGPFQRARTLTQQLLTFAKGGEISKVPLRLGDLVPGILQFLLGDGPVRWTLEVQDPPWPVLANEPQILQVFENLFLNAKQAQAGGGLVSVQIRNVPEPGPEGRDLPARPYVEAVIEDSGTGLDPNTVSKIFDPFYTTKTGGTGLGLSICFSVIKKHGGVIEADNGPRGGARFRFYLPAHLSPGEAEG